MRIEGRAALDYPAYRRLLWASSKGRFLRLWAGMFLVAVAGLIASPPAGVVLVVAVLVALPLYFDWRLRRVWRRLSAGGPAMEIGYELTDEGVRVCLAGVSTQHRWESLRPMRETAGYWLFRGFLSGRTVAVPRDAFSADERREVDVMFAGLR